MNTNIILVKNSSNIVTVQELPEFFIIDLNYIHIYIQKCNIDKRYVDITV